MGRRQIRRTRLPVQDAPDEDADADEDQEIETGLDELQAEADAREFDQSFLARKQDFQLEGDFSPAPFPLQVIPRVAYTINYNFVYSEEEDRWEPDTGNRGILQAIRDSGTLETEAGVEIDFGSGLDVTTSGTDPVTAEVVASGGGGGQTNAATIAKAFGSRQTIPSGIGTQVTFDVTRTQAGTVTADLTNNRLEIADAGQYLVAAYATYNFLPASSPSTYVLEWVRGSGAISGNEEEIFVPHTTDRNNDAVTIAFSTVVEFADTDTLELSTEQNTGGGQDMLNARLSAAKL